MIRRIGIVFILACCFLVPAWAQQPVSVTNVNSNGQKTSANSAPIVVASDQSAIPVSGYSSQNTSDAAWTSATSINTRVTQISNVGTYNSILVTLVQGTTISGGVITFQQSNDNTNWVNIQCVNVTTTMIVGPTYTLVASTNANFLCPLDTPYFGILLSTAITGSATVTVGHNALTLPNVGLLAGTETLAAGANTIGAVTGSGVFEVGPTTAANTVSNAFFDEMSDGTNAMGAMANFGTSPGAVKALNNNSSLFVGTTVVSASAPVPVSATAAANTKTNEIFANLTDHTNSLSAAISALGTAPTGTEVMAVNNVALPSTAAGAAVSTTSLSTSTTTTGTNIKASAGNLYGIFAINGVASTCWVEFVNSASTGTLGTAAIVSFPLPASTTQPIWIPLPYPINFTTGIAVGTATTNNGSTACGTATALVVQYK